MLFLFSCFSFAGEHEIGVQTQSAGLAGKTMLNADGWEVTQGTVVSSSPSYENT
jgi:hypothetical protein